jgi:ketosteroid isomerase-like protein
MSHAQSNWCLSSVFDIQERRGLLKRIVLVVSVVVFTAATIAQTLGQPRSGSAERELIKLEKEWSDAFVKRDLAALDRLEADGIVQPDSDGSVFTKSEDIEQVKTGVLVVTSVVQDDIEARVYGDAAVVTYRSTEKGQFRGKDYNCQFRYTDTWVKKAGHWQLVAAHFSKIAAN